MKNSKFMKALVAYGRDKYVLEENYPVPECGPDDVIIKTEACGICAGDLKCQHGASMFWGDDVQPSWVNPPFIPGHEFIGKIVKIGENVENYSLGERLSVEQIAPCNSCRFCLEGDYWMCQPHEIYGFTKNFNGGMAEYVRIPLKNSRAHKIPEDMPIEKALCIEPYACSMHCVDRAQITPKDIVVISGCGPLGLGMVTYATTLKPKMLIALDRIDSRLDKAKEFGADMAWNIAKMDVYEEISKLTDGYGCDVYIETAGHPSSVVQGMQMIRKLGRFVEFSVFSEPTVLDWSIIGDRKELDVLGSHLGPNCFRPVIDGIYSGLLKTDGIVSSCFKLDDWQKAFEHASGAQGDLKVAFSFK